MAEGFRHRTVTRRNALTGLGLGALVLAAEGLAACTSSKAPKQNTPSASGGSASSGSVSPVPTATPDATVPAPSAIHDVTTLGAVGDGSTDDTAAIQAALDGLKTGEALSFPTGKTFCHDKVLTVRTAGVQLLGPGTLLATAEGSSALQLQADDIVVDRLVLNVQNTTRRWSTPDQHKLMLGSHSGIVVRDVTISGSAAAGLFSLGASNFLFQRVTVSDTRADGIHLTNGSQQGTVDSPQVNRSGDDGVAVVSYLDDSKPCRDITVLKARVHTTTGGRGISVVGGDNVTYTDIDISDSYAASVYIACEGGDSVTYPTRGVRVNGGSITGANTDSGIDHGAVLVYSGRHDGGVSDVVVDGLTISHTRPSASRQVGVVADNGNPVSGIRFQDLKLDAEPTAYQGNAPTASFTIAGVTAAGKTVEAP